jgi:hypothetical protein
MLSKYFEHPNAWPANLVLSGDSMSSSGAPFGNSLVTRLLSFGTNFEFDLSKFKNEFAQLSLDLIERSRELDRHQTKSSSSSPPKRVGEYI